MQRSTEFVGTKFVGTEIVGTEFVDGRAVAPLAVGVVGAGRVGLALAAGFARAGHHLAGVAPRSPESRGTAAGRLPGVPLLGPADLAAQASVLLVTVPDDAVASVVMGLAADGVLHTGQAVVHTSGRHGLAVLDAAAAAGAIPLALHPAMTFQGTSEDVERLTGTHFGVTARGRHWALAEQLVAALGGHPVSVPEELRPLWHAGLAHGANHLVTLVSSALEVIRATGASDPAAVLRPLLTAALDGALASGMQALTGPVARGDAATVSAHLDALAAAAATERPVYLALARATADRTARGSSPAVVDVLNGIARGTGADTGPASTGRRTA